MSAADGSGRGRPILVLATRNPDKVKELRELLAELPLTVEPASAFPEVPAEIEETEPDLAGNAMLKARTVARACGHWALADDTGLEVDHLGGRPGVETARFAGPNATYDDNVKMLLERLKGVAAARRGARFRTVVALSDPNGVCSCVEGVCPGTIAEARQGSGGFGYDPIFCPAAGDGRTFAEMTRAEKGEISHRGQAMRAAKAEIARRMGATAQARPGGAEEHAARAPESGSASESASESATRAAAAGAVLVIDDEEIIREITEELLLTQGYRVHTAAGGAEAVAFLRAEHEPLRCILLDQTMPGMTGEACLREIREIDSEVRVVLCSGQPATTLRALFDPLGVQGYLQKPFGLKTLVAAIEGVEE